MKNKFYLAYSKLMPALLLSASLVVAGCSGSSNSKDKADTDFMGGDLNLGFAFGEMRLLYLAGADARTPATLYGVDTEGNAGIISHEMETASGEHVTAYSASTDERLVAYTTRRENASNVLWVADLKQSTLNQASGNEETTPEQNRAGASALTWNHTGNQLLFLTDTTATQNQTPAVWDASSGKTIHLAIADNETAVKAIWSADGTQVIFATQQTHETNQGEGPQVAVHYVNFSDYKEGAQNNASLSLPGLISSKQLSGRSVTELGVSANGSYMHVVVDDNTLHVLDMDMQVVVDGEKILDAYRSSGNAPLYARWSAFGADIAYVNAEQHLVVNTPATGLAQVYDTQTTYAFAWGQQANIAFINGSGSVIISDDASTGVSRVAHLGTDADTENTKRLRVSWVGDDVFFSAKDTEEGYALYFGVNGRIAHGFDASNLIMQAPETVSSKDSHLLFEDDEGYALFSTTTGGNITRPAHNGLTLDAAWIKPGFRDNFVLGLLIIGHSNVPRVQGADAFGGNVTAFQLPIEQGQKIISFTAY